MQYLRLENLTRFIEWMLLIMVGIFAVLLAISIAGGAIPISSWATNPNFMKDLPPAYLTVFSMDSNVQSYVTIAVESPDRYPQPAVLYTTEWHTLPIMRGALIAAGIIAALGIVYLLLRLTHRGMSREIFP